MTNLILMQRHPVQVVSEVTRRTGRDLVFTYSRYQVAPPGEQAAAPRSPTFRVPAQDVKPEWLLARLAELGPKEELAWHSLVERDSGRFHVPMIDFCGRPDALAVRGVWNLMANELGLRGDFVLFGSGRSFHGYFSDLISESMWSTYLGELLLINQQDCPPIIDARWVGHALVRGFAALRWSHNTSRYLAAPRLVELPEYESNTA